ncbi:ABC transporter permease [Ectobacillus panaciterrae]|uniref:ABC transporter permease n=1 Tax=Ectobacillus panaciterrae TaxID=363872 RepID=UPI000417A138|nr:ABC transporter permease [Ectobacillus panaciterrae]
MNAIELWKQRFALYLKEIRTYSKYIFNDHISIVLIFALGIGTFYYRQWLETLTPAFPAAFIIAAVFAIILTAGSIQTLLKPADLVFLLPLEEKLKPYFGRAFRFSYIVQLYIIGMIGAAFAPLYLKQLNESGSYVLLLVLIALVKLWNLLSAWESAHDMDGKVRLYDWLLRLGVNFLFVYFLTAGFSIVYPGSMIVVMLVYFLLLQRKEAKKGLHWEHLIDEEGRKMLLFYRIANLFTDVPALKERVQRRKWLDGIASLVPFHQKNAYSYLYIRTFLRSGNYLGLFLRLLILGSILIYFVPFLYGRLFISILFLYLMGYQTLSLWKQHRFKLWLSLYPLQEEDKMRSFLQLLVSLLFVSSAVFATVFAFGTKEWVMAGLLLLCNVVVSYIFTYGYGKRKIQNLL